MLQGFISDSSAIHGIGMMGLRYVMNAGVSDSFDAPAFITFISLDHGQKATLSSPARF